jgi:hypothetical protein
MRSATATPAPVLSADTQRVIVCCRSYRFDRTSEATLQAGLALAMTEMSIPFEREVVLAPGDRIDFLVGNVGVELKIKGSASEVMRQLSRYSKHERIKALVLVTTRSIHIGMPRSIGGKALHVHFIGGLS